MEFKSLVKTIWMTRILFWYFQRSGNGALGFFWFCFIFLHRNPLQEPQLPFSPVLSGTSSFCLLFQPRFQREEAKDRLSKAGGLGSGCCACVFGEVCCLAWPAGEQAGSVDGCPLFQVRLDKWQVCLGESFSGREKGNPFSFVSRLIHSYHTHLRSKRQKEQRSDKKAEKRPTGRIYREGGRKRREEEAGEIPGAGAGEEVWQWGRIQSRGGRRPHRVVGKGHARRPPR